MKLHFHTRLLGLALFSLIVANFCRAQSNSGTTFDAIEPPGNNYEIAAFKLWFPQDLPTIRAVLVLMPGSNGDARPQVDEEFWRKFATDHSMALLGCRFTDKLHEDQKFIEYYADVSKGSGPALLSALVGFSKQSKHPELADAPLFLWGMSAGGEFNYEFVAWKPERVAAFVVNKGGIYFSALLPKASRNVPGMLFVGGKDLPSRINIISGLFALNRRGGAFWALAEEPSADHVVGKSREVATMFFDEILKLRLSPTATTNVLAPIAPGSGFIGDLKAKTFLPAAEAGTKTELTVWLPTASVARAWQAMVTEQPLEH